MKDNNHDEAMAEEFKRNPAYAVKLLNGILEDREQGELLIALRQMAKAFGGVQTIAEKADLNPTQLYRTLSEEGKPGTAKPLRDSQSHGPAACSRTPGAPGPDFRTWDTTNLIPLCN